MSRYTVEIVQDEYPTSPVEDFLEVETVDRWREKLLGAQEDEVIEQLGCLAYHQCGYIQGESLGVAIYAKHAERILGRKHTPEDIAELNSYAQFAAQTMTEYCNGDVWGIIIKDADGNVVDSCYGFYGYRYAEQEAARMLEEWENSPATLEEAAKALQSAQYDRFLAVLDAV